MKKTILSLSGLYKEVSPKKQNRLSEFKSVSDEAYNIITDTIDKNGKCFFDDWSNEELLSVFKDLVDENYESEGACPIGLDMHPCVLIPILALAIAERKVPAF